MFSCSCRLSSSAERPKPSHNPFPVCAKPGAAKGGPAGLGAESPGEARATLRHAKGWHDTLSCDACCAREGGARGEKDLLRSNRMLKRNCFFCRAQNSFTPPPFCVWTARASRSWTVLKIQTSPHTSTPYLLNPTPSATSNFRKRFFVFIFRFAHSGRITPEKT